MENNYARPELCLEISARAFNFVSSDARMAKGTVDTAEKGPHKICGLPILPRLKCTATKNVGFGVGVQVGSGVGNGVGVYLRWCSDFTRIREYYYS